MNRQPESGIRTGFLLVMAGVITLLLAAVFLLRSKPTALSSTASRRGTAAPAPTVNTVRAAPPAPAIRPAPAVSPDAAPSTAAVVPKAGLADALGLEVVSVRLTAAGRALDVRYRVLDPTKAASLDSRENMAYLVDEISGTQIGTPQPPPPLEVHKPADGRVYGVMFANTGGALRAGSKVTLVVGQAHAKDLTVE